MKTAILFFFFSLLASSCSSQEVVSTKKFAAITLVNRIDFYDSKFNQSKFSCGFLLQHQNDTFAVTAKHLLKIIKPDNMVAVTFENSIKSWTLYPLSRPSETVITDKLLNENKHELLDKKSTYEEDWLLFSLKANHSAVKPLQLRTTALLPGEKLYVVGWTRKMETGEQRVYEFEYYKTIGNRILLKEVLVPEQFGGLSGAPLVDATGLVVGLVSNGTIDPVSNKKYFSPCALTGLTALLDNQRAGK